MKKLIILLTFLISTPYLYSQTEKTSQVKANFSVSSNTCLNDLISFTNLSTPDFLSFHWDFGDGEDSQQENPYHIYDEPGTYLVTLTATDLCNQTDIYSQTIQIIPSYDVGGYNTGCCSENTSLVTYDITDYTVSGNETWTSSSNPANNSASFYVKGTITVPAGNILIIDDGLEIFFGPLGKIIVEQEAFLFVTNNTVLDGLPQCSTLWQGIEVWGHANEPQLYVTSSGSIINVTIPQGVAIISDGSQINHAHNAVLVGKSGISTAFEASHGGGLLFVSEATFNDNATSIKFTPYNRFLNTSFAAPLDNISFIQNSIFQSSGQIPDPGYNSSSAAGYTYPNAGTKHYSPANDQGFTPMHIMVNNTGKLNIRENNFSGSAIEGIEAFNASVFAEQNTFENMDFGFVGLTNLGSIFKSYQLETNNFNDINIAGVMKIGQGVINMKANTFENNSTSQMDYLLGTYLYGTFYFELLDNEYLRPAYGLGLANSGWFGGNVYASNNNVDFGNEFINTAFGSFTFANNPSANISCNTHYNDNPANYFANWINMSGSLAMQGKGCANTNSPAGNKFDPFPSLTNRLKHIYNTTNTPYTYHHHNDWPAGCADCVVPEAMGNILLNNCQINYVSESSCEICESCKTQAYIDNAKDEMEDLETELKTLKEEGLDGGNTAFLLGEVLEGGYNHYELNDILTNASPLSETIMEILIEEADTLIGDIFKDLIILNSPVSDSLWYYALAPKLENIGPEAAEEITVNHFNPTSSIRTPALIHREIEAIRIDRQSVLNSMLMDSLNSFSLQVNLDSISLSSFANISIDTFGLSAANWVYQTLLNEPKEYTNPVFTGMYILHGNADSTEALINQLPNISEEEQSLVSYFSMMKSLANDSLTPMETSESQKNQLRAMKEYEETHAVSSLASATLWLLGEKTDPLLPYLPSSKSLNTPDKNKGEKEEALKKHSYNNKSWLGQNVPNPFGEYTQIPYFVAEKNADANIRIYDIGGREIYAHKAQSGYNKHKLDVHTWSKGIYIYCLEINQQIIGHEKMVIIK